MRDSQIWRPATAVMCALLATACSGAAATSGTADSVTPRAGTVRQVVIPTGPSRIDSPLQPYMLDWRELATVNHARAILISRCMAEKGYEFDPGTLRSERRRILFTERQDLSRLYGITDARVAAVHGYAPAPIPVPDPQPLPDSAAYWSALTGRAADSGPDAGAQEPGGCAGAADKRLGRSRVRSAYGLARELWIQNQSRLQQTQTFDQVVNEWRLCMADAGYTVSSPLNDHGDIGTMTFNEPPADGSDAPTQAEIALAQADIACKQAVDLPGRLSRASRRLDSATEGHLRTRIEADRRANELQVERANAVIQASPPTNDASPP